MVLTCQLRSDQQQVDRNRRDMTTRVEMPSQPTVLRWVVANIDPENHSSKEESSLPTSAGSMSGLC